MEKATFAGGCFWGIEETFRQVDGVIETVVGYTGGTTPKPTYKQVCSNTTGHAEAIQITFDPEIISYEKLLDIYWNSIDPTQMNRQGPDYGSQYRSVIFYHSEDQHKIAAKSKDTLAKSGKYSSPIVTQIVRAKEFFPAEEYHQKYLMKKGISSCKI